MRRAVCLLLGFLALGAVVEASRLSDALDEIPKVTADDGGRPLVCPGPCPPRNAPGPLRALLMGCTGSDHRAWGHAAGCGAGRPMCRRRDDRGTRSPALLPTPPAPAVARVLKDLHDSIQQHAKEAAAAFAAKHPGGVVDKLLGGSKRRLQTIGQVRQGLT